MLGRIVCSGTVLHTLPTFVWFVDSSLSPNKNYSRPLSLEMEHKFETRSLPGFQVVAVTEEGRKSVLPVGKNKMGNNAGSKAQKRRLLGL